MDLSSTLGGARSGGRGSLICGCLRVLRRVSTCSIDDRCDELPLEPTVTTRGLPNRILLRCATAATFDWRIVWHVFRAVVERDNAVGRRRTLLDGDIAVDPGAG